MSLSIYATKAGGIGLTLCMFAAIALFLRVLYGPRGFWRNSIWDSQNCNTRQNKHASANWLSPHIKQLQQHIQSFQTQDPHIASHLQLKQEHIMRVLDAATYIAAHEPVFAPKETYRGLLLGALYHDVGRFSQFCQYQTFSDAYSCNHGHLGAKILRQQNFLQHEPRHIRYLTRAAVCLHNRFTVPKGLPNDIFSVLQGVRDADKLDIIHLMTQQLGPGKTPDDTVIMHVKNKPGVYSSPILEAVENNIPASFLDMRVVNDFRLLLCSWLGELHYQASCCKLYQTGDLMTIIEGLEGIDPIKEKVKHIIIERFQKRGATTGSF